MFTNEDIQKLIKALGGNFVTKEDLKDLKKEITDTHQEMKDGFGNVYKEFSNVRKEMKNEFSNVRKEMKDEFSNVRKEMKDEFSNVRKEMKNESKKIIEGVCEFVEQNVLPTIDETRNDLKKDIMEINSRVANNVSVDYLDEKLFDLRGDLVVLVRKEDKKVTKLIKILQTKKILTNKEIKEISVLEHFVKNI